MQSLWDMLWEMLRGEPAPSIERVSMPANLNLESLCLEPTDDPLSTVRHLVHLGPHPLVWLAVRGIASHADPDMRVIVELYYDNHRAMWSGPWSERGLDWDPDHERRKRFRAIDGHPDHDAEWEKVIVWWYEVWRLDRSAVTEDDSWIDASIDDLIFGYWSDKTIVACASLYNVEGLLRTGRFDNLWLDLIGPRDKSEKFDEPWPDVIESSDGSEKFDELWLELIESNDELWLNLIASSDG